MHFPSLLTAFTSLLSLTTLAVAQKAKYNEFVTRSNSAKGPKGAILLTDSIFNELTASPRNYSSLILFTALDARYGCTLCREFQPEFDLLASSWNKGHPGHDGLFFGILDFGAGKATFQRMGMSTAPVLMLYPPTTGASTAPIKYDFNMNENPAEAVAHWINNQTPHRITIQRPFNYVKLFTFIFGLIGTATLLKVAYPYMAPALYSRNLWAAVSLVAVLLFTSGHMFNHIRKVPYVVQNRNGGIAYIAGGFQNQYGLETQIIAVVYAVLAFSTISLCLKMPRIESAAKQKVAVMVWNLVLLVLFSFLMSIFKMKNGAYPFFLPPLIT
ncbi:hypothetical protein ABW19_dt0206850 [Dactylella cylindrospora]|nr:hypothetical protein ABW19_dt0206850 [Dactylella cylindrospora]